MIPEQATMQFHGRRFSTDSSEGGPGSLEIGDEEKKAEADGLHPSELQRHDPIQHSDVPETSQNNELVVQWDGGDQDPENPRSMKKSRRWAIVFIIAASSLCV
jgi:hypothetical protein